MGPLCVSVCVSVCVGLCVCVCVCVCSICWAPTASGRFQWRRPRIGKPIKKHHNSHQADEINDVNELHFYRRLQLMNEITVGLAVDRFRKPKKKRNERSFIAGRRRRLGRRRRPRPLLASIFIAFFFVVRFVFVSEPTGEDLPRFFSNDSISRRRFHGFRIHRSAGRGGEKPKGGRGLGHSEPMAFHETRSKWNAFLGQVSMESTTNISSKERWKSRNPVTNHVSPFVPSPVSYANPSGSSWARFHWMRHEFEWHPIEETRQPIKWRPGKKKKGRRPITCLGPSKQWHVPRNRWLACVPRPIDFLCRNPINDEPGARD